jgi:hypothetical protein
MRTKSDTPSAAAKKEPVESIGAELVKPLPPPPLLGVGLELGGELGGELGVGARLGLGVGG